MKSQISNLKSPIERGRRGESRRDAEAWPRVPLKHVCEINPRRAPSIPVGDDDAVSFVPMPAVDGDHGIIAQRLERPFHEVKKGYTYFENGDVIFAKITPCMQNGKHAVCRDLLHGFGFGSTEFHVLRPGPRVLAEWVHGFVRQRELLEDAAEHFSGAVGQQRLPEDYLGELEIPLPPLAEQERIAGRLTEQLGAVERARAAAAQRLAAAEALPAALLREVFDGPQASGWKTRTLGELLNRYNEVIHPGDRKSGEAVFVGLEHIEPHTGRRIGAGKVEFASMTGRKPTFKRGHIVYGYLRPYLNKVWVADFDGCSSVDQFAFDVNPELADTTFVAAFMRSAPFLRRAQGVTTTGQLPRISIDEIAAVKIDLPHDAPTQRRLAADLGEKLAAAEGVIARCREELAAIEALPAALLRDAFGQQSS